MLNRRTSGILLHPTSLPGPYGIGDVGTAAYEFVDFLLAAGQSTWQVLPLGPTGYGDSPYASFSSFAGNPLLISLEQLVEEGDLDWAGVRPSRDLRDESVSYGAVMSWKMPLLRQAAKNFLAHGSMSRKSSFEHFCRQHANWLDDYTLFMAVKSHFEAKAAAEHRWGAMWSNYWDADIRRREPAAMAQWRERLADEIAVQKVWQFYFFSQWLRLKHYANDRGILIIGDLPIFVALDSVDVWASPQQFLLDEKGQPTVVAGVPPDYFSETGQRWGNPLYNWQYMRTDFFSWWIRRFEGTRMLVDVIRVDHFRGFEACWSIPAGEETAVNGNWEQAPGDELFGTISQRLGELPIIAEDLGLITPAVEQLRRKHGLPGMKVLQFAFESKDDGCRNFLPHNHEPSNVVYTGTHDNDTTCGWYSKASDEAKANLAEYLGRPPKDPAWELIRMAMSSVARTAIVPMQDVLSLGSESRMNQPATTGNNWSWRLPPDYASPELANELAALVELYQRR